MSIKNIAALSLITLVIGGAGCAKIDQFGTTNDNPNGITTPVTSALLTNVLSQLGNFGTNNRTLLYPQLIAENQYTDASLYSLPQLEMGGTYSGPLQDLQTIIDYNSDPKTAGIAAANGSNANQVAIARILKNFLFWYTTDRWGDVPYSEALKGAANTAPKFDLQEDIYFGMIADLKAAITTIDNGGPIKGDIIYAGNMLAWKKLANSMRMMMAMRLTKRYPAAGGKAAVEFADAANASGGFISSNADNFTLSFPGGSFRNTWYLTYETRDDYASSKTLGDVLSGLGDTRSSVYGTNSIMFPYGLLRADAVAYGNSVGNGQSRVLFQDPLNPSNPKNKRNENSPIFIIPAATVMLARAEAYERGWMPGGVNSVLAEADYNTAIGLSYAQWGVAMPAGYLLGAANYQTGAGVAAAPGSGGIGAAPAPYDNFRVASNNVQDALTPTKLARIALQHWIAAFPNGTEAWAEQRRTGVPNLKTTRFATGTFVRRYVYGVNDYNFNNTQTKAAAARISGGDVQEGRVWWDN